VTAGDNTVTLTTYSPMTGLSGGGIGLPGDTDTVEPDSIDGSWTSTLAEEWKTRTGGAAGYILDTTSPVLTTSSTGTFSGAQGTIV